MEVFAERLRLYQKQKGLNQKQLAELAGVTQGTISAYMRNANSPTIDMISEIAKRLDVSIGWLCGEDNALSKIETYADVMKSIVDLYDAFGKNNLRACVYTNDHMQEMENGVFTKIRDANIQFSSPKIIEFVDNYLKLIKAEEEINDLPHGVVTAWLDSVFNKWKDIKIEADEGYTIWTEDDLPF